MISTSNLPPVDSENLSVIDTIGFLHSVQPIDKAEIKVGSITKFAVWTERELGALRKLDTPSPSAFAGVSVVESEIVPDNMAVLLVNDEVQAIIKLDGAA